MGNNQKTVSITSNIAEKVRDFNVKSTYGYYEDDDTYYGPYDHNYSVKGASICEAVENATTVLNAFVDEKRVKYPGEQYSGWGVKSITDNEGTQIFAEGWEKYIATGVEEVYDAFDEYEHDNSLGQIALYAPDKKEAEETARKLFQKKVNIKRVGFMATGSFFAKVTDLQPAEK